MSSSLLENAKKPYNQGFSLLIHTKVSRLSPTNLHTQRFAVAVSFRRKLLTLRQLYPRAPSRPSVSPCRMGRSSASTSLMPQLVQAVIPPQHGAFVDSKGSGNLLRIICILPTSLHIRRETSEH